MLIEQAVTQFRQLVRAHPLPYSMVCAWRRTVLHKEARLADRGSELCIEGYPSSGNTFAEMTVAGAWPGLRIATHRHCIAAVKRALELGVPTVVLIREPYDAIASCVVRFGMPLRRAVQEYRHFHEWLGGEPRPALVDFDRLLRDPNAFLRLVGHLVHRSVPDLGAGDLAQQYRDGMSNGMSTGNVNPDQWWVPHPHKEERKEEVRRRLRDQGIGLDAEQRIYAGLRARAAET